MFRGASSITLDAKGRIAFPSKYRERLQEISGGEMVLTVDLVLPCLLVFPLTEWERLEEELNRLSSTNPVHARIKRILITHATECEIDKSGRLLIPALLREHAGLSKQSILAGMGKTFQLWDSDTWSEQIKADIEQHKQDLAEQVLPELPF